MISQITTFLKDSMDPAVYNDLDMPPMFSLTGPLDKLDLKATKKRTVITTESKDGSHTNHIELEKIAYQNQIGEFHQDAVDLIIKTNILNQIAVIHDISDAEDYHYDTHQLINILKNSLIVHSKDIYRLQFIDDIEKELSILPLNYNRYVMHTMLNNIRKKKFADNLHYREINQVMSSAPPIPVEERIAIEKNLPTFRYSRQIKKKLKPFKVDQIVGAKDKENKWWLARILHVHNTPNASHVWYYVYFEGWGSAHNEWINSSTYRVRAYNPRRHFLKRS